MAWSKSEPIVICDAGPLIHLDELTSLELLTDFEAVYIPEQVWAEVRYHRPHIQLHPLWIVVPVTILRQPAFRAMSQSLALGIGEQAGLSLSEQYPDAIFLTDDMAARLAADMLGIEVHGTIGILLRSVARQQRSVQEVVQLLENIPKLSTLHVKPSLLQEMIRRLTANQ